MGSWREGVEAASSATSNGMSVVREQANCFQNTLNLTKIWEDGLCGRNAVSRARPGSLTFVYWIWVKRLVNSSTHRHSQLNRLSIRAGRVGEQPGGSAGHVDHTTAGVHPSHCEPHPRIPSHAAATTLGTGTLQHWGPD